MIQKILLITIFGLISKVSFSQDLKLSVKSVKEYRNSDPKRCYIEITSIIDGLEIDRFNQVKVKEITGAEDDYGNTLKIKDSFFDKTYSVRNEIITRLVGLTRKSNEIVCLEGVIKYYSPSTSDNSKVIIENPFNNYNKNLLGDYYSDVGLTLIDKAGLEKLEKEKENEAKRRIKKLNEEGEEMAVFNEFLNISKEYLSGFSNIDSDRHLHFYVEDTKDKIVHISILNGNGEPIILSSSTKGKDGNYKEFKLREKLASDLKIEIYIENEASIKEYNFSCPNIILP